MIIGIDARMYKEGLGIGRYIEKLLDSLQRIETQDTFVVFLRKKQWNAYNPPQGHFKKVLADIPWYSWREQLLFPLLLAREHIDVMHFPHFNVPLLYRGKMIVTIHDLIMLHRPYSSKSATTRGPLIHGIKYAAYRVLLLWISKKASVIITVSHAVKNDLIRLLGTPHARIHVIYEACDAKLTKEENGLVPVSVREPYLLYVGNAYPHKNLDTLLAAMKLLGARMKSLSLVLCGQEDFFYRRLNTTIKEMGLSSAVKHLGFVSDDMLSALYRHAAAVVMPSWEEGFGLPALEAQANGVCVAASRIPCLIEILGDSALFFDPASPEDMAKILERVFSDEQVRYTLRTRGRENVRKYSWLVTAQQTYDLYTKN